VEADAPDGHRPDAPGARDRARAEKNAETEARRRALATAIATAGSLPEEEQVLFPLAEELVGRVELERLCQSWAERRGVSVPSFALP
jgi:hypothetical protein